MKYMTLTSAYRHRAAAALCHGADVAGSRSDPHLGPCWVSLPPAAALPQKAVSVPPSCTQTPITALQWLSIRLRA